VRTIIWIMSCVAQIMLAAFFGFVGFMKATAPMTELARHHAWVAGLPEPVARLVGVSEILCAAALIVPMLLRAGKTWISLAAIALVCNQTIAIFFHALRGDLAGAIGQNLVLIGLLLMLAIMQSFLMRATRRRS
jgi:hypothetical protein